MHDATYGFTTWFLLGGATGVVLGVLFAAWLAASLRHALRGEGAPRGRTLVLGSVARVVTIAVGFLGLAWWEPALLAGALPGFLVGRSLVTWLGGRA